jgi:GT2 family glycosyltransferase
MKDGVSPCRAKVIPRVDYSIVIPVFNREDLTRQCLATLPPTLDGAGSGETIVVDNGSAPATAAVLADFPWVRVIRNDRNLGFAAACNQGARAARGRIVVHLNNDTVAAPGWLARLLTVCAEPGVGIVGAKLFFPNGTLQHVGVVSFPVRLGPEGLIPYHFLWGARPDSLGARDRADFDAVTGACLATPRDLFLELGGFDEIFWNGYEDVDYCYRVRERGRRVVFEPAAQLTHFESQSGVQRKRRLAHNMRELSARWSRRMSPDDNVYCEKMRRIRREVFVDGLRTWPFVPIPPVQILVHGPEPADPGAFHAALFPAGLPVDGVVWCAQGRAPAGLTPQPWTTALRALVDGVRTDRYVAVIDTRTQLSALWLNELINALESASDLCAACALPPAERDLTAMPMTVDGRCALIAPRLIPHHLRLDDGYESPHGALAAFVERAVELGLSVRGVLREGIVLGPEPLDAAYERRHGRTLTQARQADPLRLEALGRPDPAFEPFASIVMLSWNAPEFTEIAVRSIRERTTTPYEIIIVDNGSTPETVARVRALGGPDLRIIENDRNHGFAHGCNQGMAAARGTHVVLLNNDVVVSAGWLEALLAAHRRDPRVGISAPRSNRVAGHQQISEGRYADLDEMVAFASDRAQRYKNVVYSTNRVIGFCMCISRTVIDEVGGIDPRYDIGNFEDDDYCVRVRAAGYRIVVCEDAFIHHFGNVSFKANNVDYTATMQANWRRFAQRWGLPLDYPTNGYNPAAAIERGFDRQRDYVPLPSAAPAHVVLAAAADERHYDLALTAYVADERAWSRIAPLIVNFIKAFDANAPVRLAIGVGGSLDAQTIGARVSRAAERAGRDGASIPDIDIVDVPATAETAAAGWAAPFGAATIVAVDDLTERSPSALRRLLAPVPAQP